MQIENATLTLSTHDDLVYGFAALYGRVPLNQTELSNFQTQLDTQLTTLAPPGIIVPEAYGSAYVTANRRMPNSAHDIASWLGVTDLDVLRGRLATDMSLLPPVGTGYAGNALAVTATSVIPVPVKTGFDPVQMVKDHPIIAGAGIVGGYLLFTGALTGRRR